MLDQYSVCGLCGTNHTGTPCPPRFTPKPYQEVTPKTVYRQQTVVTYPYPPMVQLPDGSWYETPDIVTLVKLVYQLRKEVAELRKTYSEHIHSLDDVTEFYNATSKPEVIELENGGKE